MFKKRYLKPVLITSGVFIIIIGVMLYFYIKDPARNYLYVDSSEKIDIVLAKNNIGIGEVITNDNIYTKIVDKDSVLNFENIYFNTEDIVGKKALYPINQNQFLYKNYLLSKEDWYDGKVRYAVPVTIPNTVANSVRIGDYVDVLVSYTEKIQNLDNPINYDIVISKVLIEELKDSNGRAIASKDEGIVPAFAIMSFDYNELDSYLDADKKGHIFLTIYDDVSIEGNAPTYKMDLGGEIVNYEN